MTWRRLRPTRKAICGKGYNEFCRLFLNPLLLQALKGVPFHPWLRGSLRGIEPGELSRLLSWHHKLRPRIFANVMLQAWLQRNFGSRNFGSIEDSGVASAQPRISHKRLVKLVTNIKKTIGGLRLPKSESPWEGYDADSPYSQEARVVKERFVDRVLQLHNPDVVWDLGCNTGRYSLIAAGHARYVIALDGDPGAVVSLYRKAREGHSNILPLVIDLLDPSPERGWAQEERRGIVQRGPADMVLVLALVHHLAITGNVPLGNIMAWLAKIARGGIVEFVPKEDPALQRLLHRRRDIYTDYSQSSFEQALHEHFQVTEQCSLPGSGRVLYSFVRTDAQVS